MRNVIYTLSLLLFLSLSENTVFGQAAFYSVPGVNDTYSYGFDVGNGVQIGYGFGIGAVLSPADLMSSRQGPGVLTTSTTCEGAIECPEPPVVGANFGTDYSWVQPISSSVSKAKAKPKNVKSPKTMSTVKQVPQVTKDKKMASGK